MTKLPHGTSLEVYDFSTGATAPVDLLVDIVTGNNEDIELAQTISMVKYKDGTYQTIAIDVDSTQERQLRAVVLDIDEDQFNPFRESLIAALVSANEDDQDVVDVN